MWKYHMGWLLNALFGRICILLIVPALFSLLAAAECTGRPLAVVPEAVDIRAKTILEGLLELGQSNAVCFGVEASDDRLATGTVKWTKPAPVRDLLASGLNETRVYEARGLDKTVRIAALQAKGDWLGTKIPRFQCARTDIQSASNLLYMDLQIVDDHSLASRGFAGHYRTGDIKDQVGPFDEKNKSVRELLDLIVASSTGGLWLAVARPARPENLSSQPWLILEYSQPLSGNLEQIRNAEARIRSIFAAKPQ
jgi:hypothetical protein